MQAREWHRQNQKKRSQDPGYSENKRSEYRRSCHQSLVYILTTGDLPYVKIGVTKNIQHRVSLLQAGTPLPIRVAHTRTFDSGAEAFCAEQHLHGVFAKHRASSEWFAITVEAAAAALDSLTIQH